MKPFLSVIIPVHNEAKRLPLTLLDVDRDLESLDCSSEVVVVDNGSSDGTAEILRNMSTLFPYLRVVEGEKGRGKGHAVKLGIAAARGNYRFLLDAGKPAPIGKFNDLIQHFKNGYDVIVGRDSFLCFSEDAAAKIFSLVSREGRGFAFESLALAGLLGLKVKELQLEDVRVVRRLPSAGDIVDALAVKLNILLRRYKC